MIIGCIWSYKRTRVAKTVLQEQKGKGRGRPALWIMKTKLNFVIEASGISVWIDNRESRSRPRYVWKLGIQYKWHFKSECDLGRTGYPNGIKWDSFLIPCTKIRFFLCVKDLNSIFNYRGKIRKGIIEKQNP